MKLSPIDECWQTKASGSFLVLPDGCLDVIEREERLWLIGPMTKARWVSLAAKPKGLRFRPAMVRSWLGVALNELVDQVLPVEDFSSLRSFGTLDEINAWVCGRHLPSSISDAAQELTRDPNLSIHSLAEICGMSERHFRRLFLVETGLSPKVFARVQRLLSLRRAVQLGPTRSLSELTYEAGFFDQAHMSKEVKALSGLTAAAFVRTMSDFYKTSQGL